MNKKEIFMEIGKTMLTSTINGDFTSAIKHCASFILKDLVNICNEQECVVISNYDVNIILNGKNKLEETISSCGIDLDSPKIDTPLIINSFKEIYLLDTGTPIFRDVLTAANMTIDEFERIRIKALSKLLNNPNKYIVNFEGDELNNMVTKIYNELGIPNSFCFFNK